MTGVLGGVARQLHIWGASLREEKRNARERERRSRRELAFLPAVVELQETPPSPLGRAVLYVVIGLFAIAVLWAIYGQIDIIAVANGQVVPGGRSKVVQPFETGIVTAIHVRDGAHVTKGQLLIELDTTAGADVQRFENEYLAALTEVARLRALLQDRDTFAGPKGADPSLVSTHRARLRDQLTEYRALRSQAEAYRQMYEKQYVSRMQYLEVEQGRAAKAQEFAAALAEAETRARSLSKELAKARTRARHQRLTAPIDGVVQQLAVHTVGGVVTPAQELLTIAPSKDHLEIEAWVENKDIGFVTEGQQAEVKVESFPFTRYGTLPGHVVSLSRDAVPLENLGFFYAARVGLGQTTISVGNGREVPVTPGMNVSVEIKTGKRRLIEYFLSPLARAFHDSVRER